MNREEFQQLLIKHEGWRNKVYFDTRGNATCGVGFNLKAAGARALCISLGIDYEGAISGRVALTNPQVQAIFDKSTNYAIASANLLMPNFNDLPDPVQLAVGDMVFNLGYGGFEEFHDLIGALTAVPPDFTAAAAAMRSSLWANQVGVRATDDINLVLSVVPTAPPLTVQ